MEATVSTVKVRCKVDTNADGVCEDSNGDGSVDSDDVIAPVPVWPSAVAQFPPVPANGGPTPYLPCDPSSNGLKYLFLDNTGAPNPDDPGVGILDSCAAMIDARVVNATFPGLGTGGCQADFGDEFYSCSCADHGGQTGNVTNIGNYQQANGIFTNADPLCTGGEMLMDGNQ